MYYDTPAKQAASIFRSISHGHMFLNGNKRTDIAVIQSFAKKNGLATVSYSKLMDAATKVATGEITDIIEISNILFR